VNAVGSLRKPLERVRAGLTRLGGRQFDRREGVDTGGQAEPVDLTVVEGDASSGFTYAATPLRLAAAVLDAVPFPARDATFVDLGCGKGRVLLCAARRGYREVVGVEFAHELHATAVANAAAFRHRHPGTAPIRAVLGDAARFAFPSGPLAVYCNNPFAGDVMAGVIAGLRRSYEAEQRPVAVVYQQLRHEEERHRTANGELLAASGFLVEVPYGPRRLLDRVLLGGYSIRCFLSAEARA
jgi:SAM-dependent methyltransferase